MPLELAVSLKALSGGEEEFQTLPNEFDVHLAMRGWRPPGGGEWEVPSPYDLRIGLTRQEAVSFLDEVVAPLFADSIESPGGQRLAELRKWLAQKPAATRFEVVGGTY